VVQKNDLDEVTEVAPLGGAGMKSKWGTRDVVGDEPQARQLIKFPIESVSVEIKIDPKRRWSPLGRRSHVVVFVQDVCCDAHQPD
jgi:hypothetical protein